MENFSFVKFHSIGLRVWHWLNALAITGLLLTVGLRKTLFNGRVNSVLIKKTASDAGITLDQDVARKISHALVDRLWDWHIYLGYALGAILLLRLIVAFFDKSASLKTFWLGIRHLKRGEPETKHDVLHFVLVRALYISFYLATGFMVFSGLFMVFSEQLGFSEATADSVKDVHELFQWYFLVFVVAHVGGVVVGELGRYRGIVSSMIHGGDK